MSQAEILRTLDEATRRVAAMSREERAAMVRAAVAHVSAAVQDGHVLPVLGLFDTFELTTTARAVGERIQTHYHAVAMMSDVWMPQALLPDSSDGQTLHSTLVVTGSANTDADCSIARDDACLPFAA